MTHTPWHIFIPVILTIVMLCASLSAFAFAWMIPPEGIQNAGHPSLARVEPLLDGTWAATVRVFEANRESVVELLLVVTEDKAAAVAAAAAAEPRYTKPLHGDPVFTFWVNWGVITLVTSVTISFAVCLTIRKLMSAYCAKRGHSFVDGEDDESAKT